MHSRSNCPCILLAAEEAAAIQVTEIRNCPDKNFVYLRSASILSISIYHFFVFLLDHVVFLQRTVKCAYVASEEKRVGESDVQGWTRNIHFSCPTLYLPLERLLIAPRAGFFSIRKDTTRLGHGNMHANMHRKHKKYDSRSSGIEQRSISQYHWGRF